MTIKTIINPEKFPEKSKLENFAAAEHIIKNGIRKTYYLSRTVPKKYQNDPIHTLKTNFIGDKKPEKVSYNTKDRVTVNTSDTDKVATPKPKPSKLSMVGKALKKSPVTPLIAYDIGKGIFSKIMNLRGPAIRGGRAGFRSAGGNVAT